MSERTDWIQTFCGKQFYPLDPNPDDICIEDIAHALSNTCRFNGHTKFFFSVAQHSVMVSKIVPPEDAMWGLLHDASEAYVSDITRPVKPHLNNYREIEERLMRATARRFGLPWPMPDSVKHADLIALNTEKRDLMGPSVAKWACEWQADPIDEVILPWRPELAEIRFVGRFDIINRKAAA